MSPSNPVTTQRPPNPLPSRLGVSTSMSRRAGAAALNAIGPSSLSLPQPVAFGERDQPKVDSNEESERCPTVVSMKMRLWIRLILLVLLIVDSAAVFQIWAIKLAQGSFRRGLLTYQLQGAVPIGSMLGDLLMAATTLVGITGWWARAPWGRGVTLLGLGMFTYASMTSLGHALHDDPVLSIPMILTLLIAIWAVPYLLRQRDV